MTLEILPMVQTDQDNPSFHRDVVRLWCCDRNGDETCVYVEPFDLAKGPQLGDEVWWQSGKVFFDQDRQHLTKVGFSFSAPGART